ncbi:MAG: NADH:flavin oxidoreductase [Paludibacteraceae bacterium]|nr:NADH:flavin oxidoreductase [Paludibacteraceae bacterium]MBQ8715075.1 NADH:flavin oxidoreductase [Prevotella sp.]
MKTLFDTTTLGQRTLKNRIWRSATWLALADAEGNVTDEIVKTYEELAKGGAAMIVTGLTSIVEHDAEIGGGAKFYDDRFIEGHKRLTDAVHKHGALVMMQTAIVDGPVDELSTEQVEYIVRQFGDAARRAEQAGYDGVQIHAAHFFYLSKFISPLLNHRTDRYGGSQRDRNRILYEILKDMRSKTGDGFLITMKINSTDEYPGGLTVQDFLVSCKLMADAGIDAIEVSANGTSHTGVKAGRNEGYFRAAAMSLAALVDVSVVLVGGLRSIEKINQYLNEPTNEARAKCKPACTLPCKEEEADRQTKIEYVSLSRPLIREPNLINRWQSGDITPSLCVSCNTCYRTPGHQCIFYLRKK